MSQLIIMDLAMPQNRYDVVELLFVKVDTEDTVIVDLNEIVCHDVFDYIF